jgi:hypothetical protein
MKKFIHILTIVLYSLPSDGQIIAELHIDIFRPKNVKTIYTYFKSQDTLRHRENDHKILERKTGYYPNNVIKSDLLINIFSEKIQDTMQYKVFSLNSDSTIKSEREYSTSIQKWVEPAFYKYTNRQLYAIDYGDGYKITRTFDTNGRIIREKTGNKYFTMYDFVYDSLGRLTQYVCYSVKDKKYKIQTLFLFKYDYKQKSDSLFCTSTEYVIQVSDKTWDKMQRSAPIKYDHNNPEFKVELWPSYKVTVFNNRQEIIDERNGFRREKESFPGHVTWTRRTYVYEYY